MPSALQEKLGPVKDRINAMADVISQETDLLVTVPDVSIVSTGIEYHLASGLTTFTEEDLSDAVASQDDPAIVSPRIWIGHEQNGPIHGDRSEPLSSGYPAIGKIDNMRLSADRQTVIGDYVGMPKWLADILPSAYPGRSVEGNFNVETVTGHKWQLVITDLALLGVVWPGVSTLEDIKALYSPEGPDNVKVIKAKGGQGMTRVAASVNIEDVRRQYYESLDADQTWWWIRAVYLEPNELIVDDDSGQLYRIPFTVKGEEATFDDPVPVKIQYVNAKTGGAKALAFVASAGTESAVFASRSESRPETKEKEGDVKTTAEVDRTHLTKRLGLPEDATDEQINEALTGEHPADPPVVPQPETPPAPETPETPEEEAETPESAQPAVPATASVTVPADEWARVQQQAKEGSEVAARQRIQEREITIAAAVKEGRIPPARKDHYTAMYDRDPEGTKTLLTASVEEGGLAAGLVPVDERGAAPEGSGENLSNSSYPQEWLPEVAARAAGGNGGAPTITQEA